ncbi:Biotin/lipoyl attachment domain-containing protein [Desulfonema limicola]|uniref:Biotin/lipoyl attachment domain-containing protein n=1 Tax=Desulfonema limicola TaxID=45656 RepID=A0A975GF41_9BACT|nr:acetyl-CoA carboxylase biotin carboxyl carrier protein subunit [Desulfonema limicola]QTA78881.1 Biotin/lipoyl attachment domain-containing protein [Desulfonema limicola]
MSEEILAPLAGKIVKMNLQVNQNVEEDDEALVIEAMKMETPVFVPCDGTVKEIRVKEGQDVEEDDVLAVIFNG